MTARIIDGKLSAQKLREQIAIDIEKLKKDHGTTTGLAVILVGEDPASQVYVSSKRKTAIKIGINSQEFKLNEDTSEEKLIEKIQELNNDPEIHGILVQLPLPKHIDSNKIIHTISPQKDVDGFHVINAGKLSVGQIDGQNGATIPCTPLGCLHLIKETIGNDNLRGKKAVILGSSNIVGSPVAKLLSLKKCTVTIANSSTPNIKEECLSADIIVSATGVPGLIKEDMVKQGAIIIDVGINRIKDENGKPLSGATVTITANGKVVHTATTDANGKFNFTGHLGINYGYIAYDNKRICEGNFALHEHLTTFNVGDIYIKPFRKPTRYHFNNIQKCR